MVSKNNGLFDEDTLKFAYNHDFVTKHLSNFKRLSDQDISIVSVNGDIIRFTIQNEKYRNPVYFYMINENFMKYIGRHCLVSSTYKYSKKELNGKIVIEKSKDNFDALYGRIKSILKKLNFEYEFDENTRQLYCKRLPVTSQKSKWSYRTYETGVFYKSIKFDYIFDFCKNLLFASDEAIESEFSRMLSMSSLQGKWITKEEKEAASNAALSIKLQKQREFI